METREHCWAPELRNTGGKTTIGGYAAVYFRADEPGTEYQLRGDVFERIMPGAFTQSIAGLRRDVRALAQHNREMPIGRQSAGTLRLSDDARGLRFEVDLPDTTAGRDLAESVARGDIDGSSFGFSIAAGGQNVRNEDDRQIRELTDLDLIEVSPVTFPAYEGSSVSMRMVGDELDASLRQILYDQRAARHRDLMFDIYCES